MSGVDSSSTRSEQNGTKYHIKFDEYIPLDSEQAMRSYSTPMITTTSSSSSNRASIPAVSQPALPQTQTYSTTTSHPRIEKRTFQQGAKESQGSATRGRFIPLHDTSDSSGTPDFAFGIIHLYREISTTDGADITSAIARSKDVAVAQEDEENVLAILAVPSYMTANDFMGFVGEKHRSRVSHFRMIRTEAANRYMVLLKFASRDSAKQFYEVFNGKEFNSMEVPPKTRDFCNSF